MSELSAGTIDWIGSSSGGVIRSQAYDAELTEIQDSFHKFVFHILTQEASPLVKRCLLMVCLLISSLLLWRFWMHANNTIGVGYNKVVHFLRTRENGEQLVAPHHHT